jgi:2'-5' RNA ligase
VRPVAPFTLSFGEVGAFPSPDRPRVVFRGVRSGADPLERLASAAREAARSVGLPFDDRPFVPHLTLMRVRRPRDEARARLLLEGPSSLVPAPFEVREVLLKESLLGPAGAVHRVVRRCPLVGANVAT